MLTLLTWSPVKLDARPNHTVLLSHAPHPGWLVVQQQQPTCLTFDQARFFLKQWAAMEVGTGRWRQSSLCVADCHCSLLPPCQLFFMQAYTRSAAHCGVVQLAPAGQDAVGLKLAHYIWDQVWGGVWRSLAVQALC